MHNKLQLINYFTMLHRIDLYLSPKIATGTCHINNTF